VENASVDFVIGFVAVIWLAARRFNTPRPVRTYTCMVRYLWGSAAYVAAGAVLYVVAYSFLARAVLSPAYAALGAVLLIGFALRLPGASRVDRWIRERLQRAIGYPAEAHRFAAALAIAPFAPSAEVRDEVKVMLQGRGYDLDDDWLPAAEPIRKLWFRIATLFQQVRGWDRDVRFGGFVWLAHDEFDVLRQRFDQLSLKVVRVLETIEQLGRLWVCADEAGLSASAPQRDPSGEVTQRMGNDLRGIISRLLADLRQDLAFFNHNLCLFVSRAVLTECVSARGRHRQLVKLGFDVAPERPSTANVIALTFAFYFAAFLVFLTPILTGKVPDLSTSLSKIAIVALIQVLAVTIAIVPKPLFGFANENLRGETPWRFVLSAGLAAAVLALPLLLAFHWLVGTAGAGACVRAGGLTVMLPWLLMPFVTAASLAFLIQDGRWARIDSPLAQRFADVAVMVVVLGLALCAARGTQYLFVGCDWSNPARDAWLMGIIAVGIGYMIPNTFRRPVPRCVNAASGAPDSHAQTAPRRAPVAAET
jgi:hypothetical protein